jgi:hypothetical protein
MELWVGLKFLGFFLHSPYLALESHLVTLVYMLKIPTLFLDVRCTLQIHYEIPMFMIYIIMFVEVFSWM